LRLLGPVHVLRIAGRPEWGASDLRVLVEPRGRDQLDASLRIGTGAARAVPPTFVRYNARALHTVQVRSRVVRIGARPVTSSGAHADSSFVNLLPPQHAR
jgi:hypothetical protein